MTEACQYSVAGREVVFDPHFVKSCIMSSPLCVHPDTIPHSSQLRPDGLLSLCRFESSRKRQSLPSPREQSTPPCRVSSTTKLRDNEQLRGGVVAMPEGPCWELNKRRNDEDERSRALPSFSCSPLAIPPSSHPIPSHPMSVLRKALSPALRELRVFGCQTSPASAGFRSVAPLHLPPTASTAQRTRPNVCIVCSAFVQTSYLDVKKANPDLPILIREAQGTPARAFARFGE